MSVASKSFRPIDTAAVASHYDDLDIFYRDIWGEHVHHGLWLSGKESSEVATRQLIDYAAKKLSIKEGARIVDIGCGYGGTSRWLAETYAANVVGFTVAQKQADFAGQQSTKCGSVKVHCQDWLKNELPHASFDFAWICESSEHVADKAKYFREAARVLKPGGRMIVYAWLTEEAPNMTITEHLLEPICTEGQLPGMGSFASYTQLMSESGFEVIAQEDLSAKVARTWTLCIARLIVRLATRSDYRSFLVSNFDRNARFAVTLLRIRLAFFLGSMRYGLFVLQKR